MPGKAGRPVIGGVPDDVEEGVGLHAGRPWKTAMATDEAEPSRRRDAGPQPGPSGDGVRDGGGAWEGVQLPGHGVRRLRSAVGCLCTWRFYSLLYTSQ